MLLSWVIRCVNARAAGVVRMRRAGAGLLQIGVDTPRRRSVLLLVRRTRSIGIVSGRVGPDGWSKVGRTLRCTISAGWPCFQLEA